MSMRFSSYRSASTWSDYLLSTLDVLPANSLIQTANSLIQTEQLPGISQELVGSSLQRLSRSSSYAGAVLSAINNLRVVKRFIRPTPVSNSSQGSENSESQQVFGNLNNTSTGVSEKQTIGQLSANSLSQVVISSLCFSGNEGSTGTFQIRLSQAPTSNTTLTFTAGSFLVVDADGNVQNGTQNTITFTSQNWNQTHTVSFIAEVDGVSTNREQGNTISYALEGGLVANGVHDLGTITNTYTPDSSRFNIDLDFRNDYLGFWTSERRSIAQKAANDWAERIANEWSGLQLNGSIKLVGNDGSYTNNAFMTQRYVDDLVVYVSPLNSNGLAGGFGGPEYDFGGWITSPELMPRVGQIAIDIAVGDEYLYNAVAHEIGHALGLVGLNWAGYLQQDLTNPQTAVFKGEYSRAANGGSDIPLQSQDGANPITGEYDYWHPASQVYSIMSYRWLYEVPGATAIDYAILADSGYSVYGITASLPATRPTIRTTSGTSSSTTSVNSSTGSTLTSGTSSTGFQRPTPAPRGFACNCLICSGMWTALNSVSDFSAAIALN